MFHGPPTPRGITGFSARIRRSFAREDWYVANLAIPVSVSRIVFKHGRSFHDRGCSKASIGEPRVQVQTLKDGDWISVGTVVDYPNTTTTSDMGIKPDSKFTLRPAKPAQAVADRVSRAPASGDNPAQAFSSRRELEAFAP